jgi:hypothetical protein
MTIFANQKAFEERKSHLLAQGHSLSQTTAIVDLQGNVLAHARSGGMIGPKRFEIHLGVRLFRFGQRSASNKKIVEGGWWIEKTEFEKLRRFAASNEISIGMAMRLLCLVPPEWSDASVLIKAYVSRSVLAWRGLGNSVVTPMGGGGGMVRMPHHNEIEARRLYQLFIPGLSELPEPALTIEQEYPLSAAESARGFLYL